MNDFQQDFMQKVKNPTIEGEVVGSSGAPKKPFDKRWIIIGALILILVVIFIVLLIISNSNNSNGAPAAQALPQGDPISQEEVTSTKWSCSYNATMTFYSDGKLIRTTPSSESEFTYTIDGTKLTYGNSTGVIKDNILTINHANGDQSTCRKENS